MTSLRNFSYRERLKCEDIPPRRGSIHEVEGCRTNPHQTRSFDECNRSALNQRTHSAQRAVIVSTISGATRDHHTGATPGASSMT